jgi:hypothetical protein
MGDPGNCEILCYGASDDGDHRADDLAYEAMRNRVLRALLEGLDDQGGGLTVGELTERLART